MNTVHSEERNFACEQCDYKTKTGALLMKHVRRIHLKERNFVCDVCNKCFFSTCKLKDHSKTHINCTNENQTEENIAAIGELYDSFDCKRALVKYQSQSKFIKVLLY